MCEDNDKEFSVPFPGILFLNYLAEGYECESGAVGFRPLPGDLISQFVKPDDYSEFQSVFPSPSRGSYFSMREK